MRKRLLAIVLCVAMIFGVAACGKEAEQTTETNQTSEFVYVPEYSDWGIEEGENDWINTYGVSNGYLLGMLHKYNSETYETISEFLTYKLEDGTVTRIPLDEEDGNINVSNVALMDDGNILAYSENYSYDEATGQDKSTYALVIFDAAGQMVSTADITAMAQELKDQYGYFYVQDMKVDAEGTIYITVEQQVIALNADGSKLFAVESTNWINSLGRMADGTIYITYYGSDGNEMALIDKANKSLGKTYQCGSANGFFSITDDMQMIYSDSIGVKTRNLETGETTELFQWLDADVIGNYVDGIYAVSEDVMYTYIRDWNTNEENIVKLTKTDSSTIPQKEILTIAAMSQQSDLQSKIVKFNKQSDTYRIKMKYYFDQSNMTEEDYKNYEELLNKAVTNMVNDITGDNPPDMIIADYSLGIDTLVKKGAVEELMPYLEDAGYSEEDFVKGVVESYKIDGKIYSLPTTFSIQTGMADSAIVGTEPGWTLQEALEVIKNLPEGMEFTSYMTQGSFVNLCLMYAFDTFIDTNAGTCNFDSPEFLAVLEAAKSFPKEYPAYDETVSEPDMIQNGEILYTTAYISSLNDIQMYEAFFGDLTPTYIGYPGAAGNGSMISSFGGEFLICSKSNHKDIAAQFIIDGLMDEDNNQYYSGFPVLKEKFDEYIASELEVTYLKDPDGNVLLDEEGNPIPAMGGSSVGMGNWVYEFKQNTQEEADTLMKLLDGMCAKFTYNTEYSAIITEELEPYFNGQKSAQDTAAVIQNRISLYLAENN